MLELRPFYLLHDVVLGETSEIDFFKAFGAAKTYSSGGRSAEDFSCYINPSQPGVLVRFSFGFPYEQRKVFGFELNTFGGPSKLCSITTRDLKNLASGSGVALGMTRAAFVAAVQLPFVARDGETLLFEQYEDPHARPKTLELTVKASFKDDLLVAYAVRRYI